MVKCPFCGFEEELDSFKQLRDPWNFRFYVVKKLQCLRCNGIFNYYHGVSGKGKYSEFVIRIKPRALE
ncbi:MAG: hypothetical protein QXG12_04345 [Thermoproteota archaeon]